MNDVARMISIVNRAVTAGAPPEKVAVNVLSKCSEQVRNNPRLPLVVDTLIDVSESEEEKAMYEAIRKLI
jgi:hypothetical protein